MLTRKRLDELFTIDVSAGTFTWKAPTSNRVKIGDLAGTIGDEGHRTIKIDGVKHLAHRLIWFYVYGEFPPFDLDHRDTNPDHNWPDNLRETNHASNAQNMGAPHSDKRDGLKLGVYRAPSGRFLSKICTNGVKRHLGTFDTEDEAHDAYLSAKAVSHPAFVQPRR